MVQPAISNGCFVLCPSEGKKKSASLFGRGCRMGFLRCWGNLSWLGGRHWLPGFVCALFFLSGVHDLQSHASGACKSISSLVLICECVCDHYWVNVFEDMSTWLRVHDGRTSHGLDYGRWGQVCLFLRIYGGHKVVIQKPAFCSLESNPHID